MLFDFDLMYRGLIMFLGTALLISLIPVVIMASAIIFGLILLSIVRVAEAIHSRVVRKNHRRIRK